MHFIPLSYVSYLSLEVSRYRGESVNFGIKKIDIPSLALTEYITNGNLLNDSSLVKMELIVYIKD